MATIAATSTAQAHGGGSFERGWLYGSPTMCTYGDDFQYHGYSGVRTSAYGGGFGSCAYGFSTWYVHNEVYKAIPGRAAEYCGSSGWYYSSTRTYRFVGENWIDLWSAYPCNYGFNVNVEIFIDGQYADLNNTWYGSAWRPATSHCHCP